MANFDYSEIMATANRLIKEFGNYNTPAEILRTVEAAAPDLSKPWRRGNPTILSFPSIVFDKTSPDQTTDDDREVIAPGDLRLVPATGSPGTLCGDPTIRDRILLNGTDEYAILFVEPIRGAGVPIIYKLRCRAWQLLMKQPSTPF